MTKKDKKDFDEILLESIDEALTTIGETVMKSIYFHLEKEFSIQREDIPQRVGGFSNALERIFGVGARHIEILIMKSLHNRVKCQYGWEGPMWLNPDLTFMQYIELNRLSYEENREIGEFEVLINAQEKQELSARRRL